jgi:hypothetical protein
MASACAADGTGSVSSTEPWGTNVVAPASLVAELANASGLDKPVVVYTGPVFLFRLGHVPGAVSHGPASTPDGLADLEAWARSLPRTTNLVVYCGCCPIAHCPNLRPAFGALQSLGFTRLRVLMLPSDFGTDWVNQGLPVEK